MIETLFGVDVTVLIFTLTMGFIAGAVKGAIGFAMPLILIVTLPIAMPLPQALAAMILPIIVANLHQALRDGWPAAVATLRRFWRFALAMVLMLMASAPLLVMVNERLLFGVLGVSVLAFAVMQLSGWLPVVAPAWRGRVEWTMGAVAGFYGGVSGVWGPPTVSYMLAARVEKREMARALCALFALGAVILLVAHLRTGVLNAQTAPLSALMVLPATLGTLTGFAVQDRLPQEMFRKVVMAVLIVTALNLLRRAIWG